MIEIHPTASHQELIDNALARLSSISFADVRMKLADPKEGKGWDETILDWAEQEYRRFLALNYAYPDRTIVPDETVDEFWHQHILDTRAYAHDTVAVFGYFLHHFPYLGTRGPEDEEKLVQCFSDTRDLHEAHFGRSKTNESSAFSRGSSCGKCSRCSRGGN
jgi:hypothetical protein